MTAIAPPSPSSLPSPALARRIEDLCRAERNLQADFLLHLDEYDRRRAYLEAGYGSLWSYCLEALHLRESAAGRRIGAMKVLRGFPALEPALRDGRLCLSTVCMVGRILTEENLAELVARAAFLSKADTEKLIVSVQPRSAPRDGLRRLARSGVLDGAASPAAPTVLALIATAPSTAGAVAANGACPEPGVVAAAAGASTSTSPSTAAVAPPRPAVASSFQLVTAPTARHARRAELRPIAPDLYSLRVTVDAAFKADFEELAALTSHTHRGDFAAVLREGLRCAIAKHGRRKGTVESSRKVTRPASGSSARPAAANDPVTAATECMKPSDSSKGDTKAELASSGAASIDAREAVTHDLRLAPIPSPAQSNPADPRPARVKPPGLSPAQAKPTDPRAIPMEVRRAVWKRDGGRCAWTSPDGRRCGSRHMLELDHIQPAALGGLPTIDNLRVACKPHNIHEAVRVFGRERMAPHLGEFATPGGSDDK